MSRYIDADKLQERLQEEFDREGAKAYEMAICGCTDASVKYGHGQFCYLNAKELVKDAPTAAVAPIADTVREIFKEIYSSLDYIEEQMEPEEIPECFFSVREDINALKEKFESEGAADEI